MTTEIQNNYHKKLSRIKDEALPVIARIYESKDNNYNNILIPFSDGIKKKLNAAIIAIPASVKPEKGI